MGRKSRAHSRSSTIFFTFNNVTTPIQLDSEERILGKESMLHLLKKISKDFLNRDSNFAQANTPSTSVSTPTRNITAPNFSLPNTLLQENSISENSIPSLPTSLQINTLPNIASNINFPHQAEFSNSQSFESPQTFSTPNLHMPMLIPNLAVNQNQSMNATLSVEQPIFQPFKPPPPRSFLTNPEYNADDIESKQIITEWDRLWGTKKSIDSSVSPQSKPNLDMLEYPDITGFFLDELIPYRSVL